FELHIILLLANIWFSELKDKLFFRDIINALEVWGLTNLKFYVEYDNANFIDCIWEWEEENLLQYTIPLSLCTNNYFSDLENLIQRTLKLWARKNAYTQEIVEAIKNATAFIKLMEKPFIQLVNNYNSYKVVIIREKGKHFKELKLDSLPFGIFPKLLQLFKPLEHITCRSRSNPDEISTEVKKYALIKCKAYYLKNIFSDDLGKSIQASDNELECYINRPQSSLDGDTNPYEWWQGSKQMLPGLAALASEYLPTLT
ncbi:6551_t:CDS:2, partial [Gigaspora margarita]